MSLEWIESEFKTVSFNDQRLDHRFMQILGAFSSHPTLSIPAACQGRNEFEACYRFFDNEKVTPQKIWQPHFNATMERCRDKPVVLVPQDTTELDFSRPEQQVVGAGPLDGSSRRGAFLHTNQAFTTDGLALGILSAKIWARDEPDPNTPPLSQSEKQKKSRGTPFEQRESFRWFEGMQAVQQAAEQCPETQFISLNDSEGDMFELLRFQRRSSNFHWIIRACHDRQTLDEAGELSGLLRSVLQKSEVLFPCQIQVRRRDAKVSCETRNRRVARQDRIAAVSVRADTMLLPVPAEKRAVLGESIAVNVVWVLEEKPPEGEAPLEWILLTTLPISTQEEIRLVMDNYTTRWMIEIYHRVLKSGCRVEERRFETLPRMLNCMAIYMVVAWRILFMCWLGRHCPEMPCDVVFDDAEWQAVYKVLNPKKNYPLNRHNYKSSFA